LDTYTTADIVPTVDKNVDKNIFWMERKFHCWNNSYSAVHFVTLLSGTVVVIHLLGVDHSWAPMVKKTSIGSIPIIDRRQKALTRSMVVIRKKNLKLMDR
jgi:hypothetical protein